MSSLIERQAAIDAVNSLIDRFERILSDIRESTVDDSVCGMCEYDGAYMGQSGDWCNECPGFEKDNCFKLSDQCRKRWFNSVELPSAQQWIPVSERLPDAGEYYFVTVQYIGWNCTEYREIDIAKYELDGWRSCHNVLAWCPLPEPWKGERDG